MYVIVIISATIRGYDDRVVVVRSNGSALFSILSRVLLAVVLLHRHYIHLPLKMSNLTLNSVALSRADDDSMSPVSADADPSPLFSFLTGSSYLSSPATSSSNVIMSPPIQQVSPVVTSTTLASLSSLPISFDQTSSSTVVVSSSATATTSVTSSSSGPISSVLQDVFAASLNGDVIGCPLMHPGGVLPRLADELPPRFDQRRTNVLLTAFSSCSSTFLRTRRNL